MAWLYNSMDKMIIIIMIQLSALSQNWVINALQRINKMIIILIQLSTLS